MSDPASLTSDELADLIERVFQPTAEDRGLAILVDLPDDKLADNADWRARRRTAVAWRRKLAEIGDRLGLKEVAVAWYPNAGGNNADLPQRACVTDDDLVRHHAEDVASRLDTSFSSLFDTHSIVLAPTELSTTAPLKVAARRHPMRAATMPGFKASMIPALRIDYVEVNRRVDLLKEIVDRATSAFVTFRTLGKTYELEIDLRYRTGHASGGLLRTNGVAGNLPSGETYIVPYEGERADDPSLTQGEMPVQFEDEVVVYRIAQNLAVDVTTTGKSSDTERQRIQDEPAYANLAELGLGVLDDFGIEPIGEILLDEKLGLHIAFGRSDHFGGQVGPDNFSKPEAVVHIDRVYIEAVQPKVQIASVKFNSPDGTREIIQNGRYHDVW